jgi:TRAP-type C4-dicarboxylate transport system substrate-binding protein
MTRTNHIYQTTVMVISTKTWNKLTKEQQKIFLESLESPKDLRVAVRGAIKFFEKKHLEAGHFIHDLNDAERKIWSDTYTEKIQKKLIKAIGGDAERVFKEIIKARNACNSAI